MIVDLIFFIGAMNEVNPALNVSDDTMESIIGSFVRLREILLSTLVHIQPCHINTQGLSSLSSSRPEIRPDRPFRTYPSIRNPTFPPTTLLL